MLFESGSKLCEFESHRGHNIRIFVLWKIANLNRQSDRTTVTQAIFDESRGIYPIHYMARIVGEVSGSGEVRLHEELSIPNHAPPKGCKRIMFHLVLSKLQKNGEYFIYNSMRDDICDRTLVHQVIEVDQMNPRGGKAKTYRFPSGSIM